MLLPYSRRLSVRLFAGFFLIVFTLSSCGFKREPGEERSYVSPLEHEDPEEPVLASQELIMRSLPDDSLRGYGACRLLGKVLANGGAGRFRIVSRVSVNTSRAPWELFKQPPRYKDLFNPDHSVNFKHLNAMTDIGANPIYLFGLAYFADKDNKIPNSEEFFKLFDRKMFESPALFPGFLLMRTLFTVGILNSNDQRNHEIKKAVSKTFPGSFQTLPEYSMEESILRPLISNSAPRMSQLSPHLNSSLSVEDREKKFWRVLTRFTQPVSLVSSSNWNAYNQEIRRSLSVAIDSWSSRDPEEQACAAVLFQRTQAQLMTMLGHDRPGFYSGSDARTGRTSYLMEVKDLLDARDGTKIRVCPTPGSFVKKGRRAFLTLDDFVLNESGASSRIQITKGPFVPGPCLNPVPRASSAYSNYLGERVGSENIGKGKDLIDFLSAASQYMVAFNPGAPWWEGRNYPLFDFDKIEALESGDGIMPALSYALSMGFMYIGLDKVLNDHLVLVDFNNQRTSDESRALGVRFSHEPDPNQELDVVVTDTDAALRMTELAYKIAETLDRLALWNYKQRREAARSSAAMARYKKKVAGLFASEKNFNMLVSSEPGGVRDRLKKLQLATSLLVTKLAKKKENGFYTCYASLKTDLARGEEKPSAELCSPATERLFKEMSGIIAKKYSSPLFADFAGEE